jgi:hypothetical protein
MFEDGTSVTGNNTFTRLKARRQTEEESQRQIRMLPNHFNPPFTATTKTYRIQNNRKS